MPSTNASWAETNVADVAANPVGTGPPVDGRAVGAVAIGDLAGALGPGAEVAVLAGVMGVVLDEADALALEPPDPHPVSDCAVSKAAVTITTPDARRENTVLIAPSELAT
jgi:hypothetical protein